MIIGITGGTGCGKTTLLELIREQGGLVLDCDAIYHDLLKADTSLLCAIEARFPGTVQNGQLNRKKLGAIVFSSDAALKDLNRITHGAVKEEVLSALKTKPALAAIDAIGLHESGLAELCDVTVAVTAPTEARIDRLIARENVTEEYARMRIASQKSNEEFAGLCDQVLENGQTREHFQKKCLAFLESLGIMKV